MKRARKWLAALLSAVLVLGALPMAVLAEEDDWSGAAEVETFTAFQAALEDPEVERIKITGEVTVTEGTPERPLDAGEKPILVSAGGSLRLSPGTAMVSDCPQGQFRYEPAISTWDRIAEGMGAFLIWGGNHRLLLGSLPEDISDIMQEEDNLTLAVLSGDVTLEGKLETEMLFVMNGELTVSKGSELYVNDSIYAEVVSDFGNLWFYEDADVQILEYNRPRLMVCWNEEESAYDRSVSMTPYDEHEIEKFVLYDYRDGAWDYFNVDADELTFASPLFYGEVEGHEHPTLTAKGAEWGNTYSIAYRDYTPLRVYVELPEIGCYSTPGASTDSILAGSLKCSPMSSGEFYVCIRPDAWFMEEGYTVSDLNVEAVRYEEDGGHAVPNPPVEIQKAGNGIWKITAGGCDFNVEPRVTVTSPDGEDSFDIGTGIFLDPAEILVYSGAPLDGEANDWGILWEDACKSALSSTLSLKAGASKDVYLYLLVYQSKAEDGKPAGWYCEDINIHQIRAEGVTVAQAREDDGRVIRVTAESAGAHKVIRMQEQQVGPDEWEMIPGSTRGEPLNVTVAPSGISGGSSSGGSSGGSISGGGTSSGGSSAGNPGYAVSVPSGITGGTVSVQPQNAKQGDTVTVTVRPEEGYVLRSLTVATAAGRKIDAADVGDGRYTFTMPGSKVTVRASFSKVQEEAQPAAESFTDVPSSAYYSEAVRWAVENGITGGAGGGLFRPDAPCTRAQTVTLLWRAAGSPVPTSRENPFQDVQSGAYYYDAVLWAVEQGITGGTSAETFSPGDTVTRGQMAAFLHRAAGSPVAESNGSFTDVPSGAYYAEAVQWAVEQGVTGGIGGGLFSPGADCTRAQIVTFLYRSQES